METFSLRFALSALSLYFLSCAFVPTLASTNLTLSVKERIPLSAELGIDMEPPTVFIRQGQVWLLFRVGDSEVLELQKRNTGDLGPVLSRYRNPRPDPGVRFFALRPGIQTLSGLSDWEGIAEYRFDNQLNAVSRRQLIQARGAGSSRLLVLYHWNPQEILGLFTTFRLFPTGRKEAYTFNSRGEILARNQGIISTLFLHNTQRNEYLYYTNEMLAVTDSQLRRKATTRLPPGSGLRRPVYNEKDNEYLVFFGGARVRVVRYTADLHRAGAETLSLELDPEEFINQIFYNKTRNQYYLAIPRISGSGVDLRIVAIDSHFQVSNPLLLRNLRFADVQGVEMPDGSELFLVFHKTRPVLFRLTAN